MFPTFFQTSFDEPGGVDPVAIDLSSMGKGQVWVNGHNLGRYWTLSAPEDGCQTCDYRGAYDSNKCLTNCGEPTQSWYYSYQKLLCQLYIQFVIFGGISGNPIIVSMKHNDLEAYLLAKKFGL